MLPDPFKEELLRAGLNGPVEAMLLRGTSGGVTLLEIKAAIPRDVSGDPARCKVALATVFRILTALKIRIVSAPTAPATPVAPLPTAPQAPVVAPVSIPDRPKIPKPDRISQTRPSSSEDAPKVRRPRKPKQIEWTAEALRQLAEENRPFGRWIELYDEYIGNEPVRDICWTKAQNLACLPVHFLALFFRAKGKEEADLLAKLQGMEAPPEEWLRAALEVNPSPISQIIIAKLPRKMWEDWHRELPCLEARVQIGSHLIGPTSSRLRGRKIDWSDEEQE